MVDTTKKSVAKSLTADMRRSAKRLSEQTRKALLTEEEATRTLARFETPDQKRKYAADMQIIDKLDAGFRGEISYKMLGNKRLRVDSPDELTREHGILRKTKKVLKRNAETGDIYLGLHEKKTWRSVSSHLYAEDGTLRAKLVKYKHGRFEEKWERDENGLLIRTRHVNRNRLFQPISEKVSAPYRSGPENRVFRELTRQKGSKQEIFERDDKGNLELVGSKRLGFSKNLTKAADRQTSRTTIRKLGGAFSKSYSSLLDKEGNELGRDISSHRRLFNKRSAVYDDASGQLKSTKHTFGKIYKSETAYLNADVKKVSKKILGVTVRRKLTALSEQEHDAQKLRNLESIEHRKAWQKRAVIPISPLREAANVHLAPQSYPVSFVGGGRRDEAETKVVPAQGQPIDAVVQTSPLFRQPNSERQVNSQTPPPLSNVRLSDPAFRAEGAKSYKEPLAINLQRDNEREMQEEKNLSERPGHLFLSNRPITEMSFPGSPERTRVLGSRRASLNPSADQKFSVDRANSQPQPVSSSPINNHQSDPNDQELLSFLHSVPVPPPLEVHAAPGGRIQDSFREASRDSLVGTSSAPGSVVDEHFQGPLERDHSTITTSERFDPQSLFGEPGLSHVSEGRPELSTERDHLTDSEQQALLNELLGVPLPGPLPKADNERSRVLERSRNRERSMSGGLSL
ncbi:MULTISPECIES: virA/G regulated protein [Rhizobium]|uniref:virA/G regulated protein n=1 Tax=Rhizobium TaxID=379 RepID=UPI0015743DA0|nr:MULTISPECIES: virA/G regulated protein [Rhizobium]MBO9126486.1 virA/G regulated protein [Rhizobium sp. 16-488-2b]MBO9178421.1 virA/G regulated protein [Rhizobium sp. 16-488-2a]MBO9194966.1 virA/G regulated protein [Rhizobium sp. 16-449-1b]NTH68704.1 virA/G regulated protein [Rhizobium rhizogenes]NTI39681.1 virA/G regulated protein [Rhizobium rhizogenes]